MARRPPKEMRFGVVTPLLNARAYFRACAASVHAASLDAPSAVVRHYVRESDRSEWPCENIAETFGCEYTRGPDAGLYDAIAAGLNKAAADGADILGWLNADEQYLPGAISTVQRIFESNENVSMVFGDYLMLDRLGVPIAARREIPARLLYLRNGVNYLLSCTVFFRREVWEKIGPFDLSYKLLADKKFYLSALGAGFKAVLASQYIGAYTSTGSNASLSADAPSEQARLRMEAGAFASPLARNAIRAMRVLDKALHGCYFPDKVETELFTPAGISAAFSLRLSPFWKDR